MAFSNKHYEAIANILATSDTVSEVTHRLGMYFGDGNPKFDADRFAKAAGVPKQGRRAWLVKAVCRRSGRVDGTWRTLWQYEDKTFEVRAGSKEGAAEQAHHYAAEQGLVIAGIRSTEEKS